MITMSKTKLKATICLLCVACISLYSCRQQQAAVPKVKQNGSYTAKGSIQEMVIEPETVTFPEHAGKAEFESYCGICHSLKYITMQPDFPRKTWDAEVHKMIEKYGAPIDSVTGKKIVDYLVAIKGNGT